MNYHVSHSGIGKLYAVFIYYPKEYYIDNPPNKTILAEYIVNTRLIWISSYTKL
tara:strand:+ start:1549 stop:1710 length:162 start_codon:yes stop_codon:yes gene_type:complete